MQGKVFVHSVPPYALAWTANHIAVAGCDKKLVFYSHDGTMFQQFDYFSDPTEKEFTTMCCSPSGQSICVGSYDRIRVYSWASRYIHVHNQYRKKNCPPLNYIRAYPREIDSKDVYTVKHTVSNYVIKPFSGRISGKRTTRRR